MSYSPFVKLSVRKVSKLAEHVKIKITITLAPNSIPGATWRAPTDDPRVWTLDLDYGVPLAPWMKK